MDTARAKSQDQIDARAKLIRNHPIFKSSLGYGKPQQKPRNRTIINMSLKIRSIDLDVSSGLFKTDGYMVLKWNTPRFGWSLEDYSGVDSIQLPSSDSWAPDGVFGLILLNAVDEKFMFRHHGIVRHQGDLIYIVSIHTKSSCKPNFEDDLHGESFHFNVQTCSLKFGSWQNEQYQVDYRVNANDSDISLDQFSSPTGWNVLATEAKLQSIQYPMFEEPSPSVEFTFSFKRDLFYDPVSGTLMKANQTTLLPQRGDQNEEF